MEASHAGTHSHEHHGEDWHDDAFARQWIDGQASRTQERHAQFTKIRAVIPKRPDQEFAYLNIGAGDGQLDEVLLEHFKGAQATLVDVSLAMLEASRERLKRFGDRVEYVQANLGTPDWVGAVGGPFDFAVSSMAVHHVGQPDQIRSLYTETYKLLGHGGMLLNLDYMRPARPSLSAMAAWAAQDPEAGLSGSNVHHDLPGTLLEHLGWLSEAGFGGIEVFWKNMNVAVICGFRDHLHMPEGHDAPAHEGGHSHAH